MLFFSSHKRRIKFGLTHLGFSGPVKRTSNWIVDYWKRRASRAQAYASIKDTELRISNDFSIFSHAHLKTDNAKTYNRNITEFSTILGTILTSCYKAPSEHMRLCV